MYTSELYKSEILMGAFKSNWVDRIYELVSCVYDGRCISSAQESGVPSFEELHKNAARFVIKR